MATVTVHQLQCKDKGLAFLNVQEEYGRIDVWGSVYNCPTYLLQWKLEFHIIQFDSQEYADEFFNDIQDSYWKKYKVTKIEEQK
jgi:hypothetical protein